MATFCQKYMAQEMLQQQHYKDGDVEQSLTRVFHKMDDMLRDAQYHEEARSKLLRVKALQPFTTRQYEGRSQ